MNLAQRLNDELYRECELEVPWQHWRHWNGSGYSGSWALERISPLDNKIFHNLAVWLNLERQSMKLPPKALSQYAHPHHGSGMEQLLRLVASHPTQITTGLRRILDFGCGDGIKLAAVGAGLQLSQKDALCLDVADTLSPRVRANVTFLLANLSEYTASLQHSLFHVQGTISIVYAIVVFHHIRDSSMRSAALNFIRMSLAPGGIFVLCDWDNPRIPVDLTVYFDLNHVLPWLLWGIPAATTCTIQPRGTIYLSVKEYNQEIAAHGLMYDEARSRIPWEIIPWKMPQKQLAQGIVTEQPATTWLDSEQQAQHSSNRVFVAVFQPNFMEP